MIIPKNYYPYSRNNFFATKHYLKEQLHNETGSENLDEGK